MHCFLGITLVVFNVFTDYSGWRKIGKSGKYQINIQERFHIPLKKGFGDSAITP